MRHYNHVNEKERCVIQKMHYSNQKKRDIAAALDRHKSTIYREISTNKTHGYNAREADDLSKKRRSSKKRKLDINGALRLIVITLLIDKNSPEVISHYLKILFPNDSSMHLSYEAIYQWIYNTKTVTGKIQYAHYLFTKRKRRQNRGNAYKYRGKDTSKKNIHQRPKEADEKIKPGHIEGDLIESSGKDAYILTLVDKSNAYTWGKIVPSKDAETVSRAVIEAMEDMPLKFVKTITFDNGTEFARHKQIEDALECEVFFANPYSPWQRGLNEHINGRIRHYLPKKKSFANLTDEELDVILHGINSRPRKSLGWLSPEFLLSKSVAFQC